MTHNNYFGKILLTLGTLALTLPTQSLVHPISAETIDQKVISTNIEDTDTEPPALGQDILITLTCLSAIDFYSQLEEQESFFIGKIEYFSGVIDDMERRGKIEKREIVTYIEPQIDYQGNPIPGTVRKLWTRSQALDKMHGYTAKLMDFYIQNGWQMDMIKNDVDMCKEIMPRSKSINQDKLK
jgi:hypothetical protein